jgi:RHS repeat-associated protein
MQRRVTLSLVSALTVSVISLAMPSNAVAGRAAAFEPFGGARAAVPGAPAAPTGPSPLLGFAGMPASGTAGGSLAGVRVLDPAEGAFTSTDPVFMSSGPAWASPYTYANNSPARYTDPAGRDALDDAGQAIMGAGDAMTFGFTGWVRENNPWFDTAGAADYCSGWYTAGTYVGAAASIVMVPGGLGLGVGTATMRMAARTGLARVEAFLARTGTSLLAKGGTLARALPAAARTATRELTTLARQAGTTARAGLERARTVTATGERGSIQFATKSEREAEEVPSLVYRAGSAEPRNLTPRPGLDPTGLSTFDSPMAAAPNGGKVQVIDTSKLKCVVACPDGPPAGHVSLRPPDSSEIPAWAATRESGELSLYTQDIMDAIVGIVRVPKP